MFIVSVIAAPPVLAAVVPVPALVAGASVPGVVATGAAVPAEVPPVVAFELDESLPQDAATNARPTAIAA